ncbi:MAG: alpha/beta hydrolase fold domain-containing protein, partial [Lachnospiraceae bacterium]|nr:alpha/beta hydrolase fold domain-containing protein [Lachnospiraceae bacterium]
MLWNRDYAGEADVTNPYLSPLFGDFTGFPPMLIQVGSYEMLLSDSVSVAQKAKEAGVKVRLSVYEGMFHVFQMAPLALPESKAAWVEIGRFLHLLMSEEGESLSEDIYNKEDTMTITDRNEENEDDEL